MREVRNAGRLECGKTGVRECGIAGRRDGGGSGLIRSTYQMQKRWGFPSSRCRSSVNVCPSGVYLI